MNRVRLKAPITLVLLVATALHASATEVKLNGHTFQVPAGYSIQRIAGPPLVQRPIHMCFDAHGVLYVTDSSGNTDKATVQLKDPQHRVLRLVDRNGDGTFDESTVFADKLPLPEGILVHDGSVYVGAPPHIWKLRDSNGDNVSDERTVWFDGGSIERCDNDMHGNVFEWCHDYCGEDYYKQSPEKDPRVPDPELSVFCGVGHSPSSRVTLVPLTALGASRLAVTAPSGFGWFVSWISSIVIQRPHTLQELRRVCGSWSEEKYYFWE